MSRYLDWFISFRFKQGRHGRLVSLISFISTLSIALGVIVIIVGLSAMNGFERELRQRILSVIPHAEFYSRTGKLTDWQGIANQLLQDKHVLSADPYVSFTGLLENGTTIKPIVVKGIENSKPYPATSLFNFVEGDGLEQFTHDPHSIIIGKGLADQLNVKKGQSITLIIPEINEQHQLKTPKRITVKVAGILTLSGNLGFKFALIHLKAAQSYRHLGDSVTGLMITVDEVFSANSLAINALKSVPIQLQLNSWEYEYGYMYRDIQMIRSIMYLAMLLVIGIACFNIVSTLVITVKDKQADIAILKTLGGTNQLIRNVFLYYGLITGLVGGSIGVIIGSILAVNLSVIVVFFETLMGHHFLDSQIYFIDFIPSALHASDVLAVFVTTLILSLLASYYPAKRACRIDPAVILSNN